MDQKLGVRDRARVAEAERSGKPTVTLLVAAGRGRSGEAADQVRGLGGVVQSAEASIDYLKVSVPTAKVAQVAKLGAVTAVTVDGVVARENPRTAGSTPVLPQTAPDAKTARLNSYLPTGDTQAAQFGLQHPSWDGKGTTIAIIDSGIDLDHPALATTSGGERKIVDWYNANPVDSDDGTWVALSSERRIGKFTAESRQWTAPTTGGPYTFGLFRETAKDLGNEFSEIGGDVNRDGDQDDAFGVLQDVVTKQVRVDLDGDGDFTDERPLIDYKVNRDVGYFGTDNPATPEVERVPFVVQTDKSNYDSSYGSTATAYVNIGIADASHGSHVAGIAAGTKLFGGAVAGAAPGARLLSIKACLSYGDCTDSGLLDGLLYAAKNGADVVNISISGLSALNDGDNDEAELYNRTIAEYDVQVFASAGNTGRGANSVSNPSVATSVVSVGASISAQTWLSNYGSVAAAKQNLYPFSARGPREDGGLKPDIVAPGSAVSTTPRWQFSGPVFGTFDLPPGYSTYSGTSMAAPQATGAAALLVSAYKSTHGGKRPKAAALRNAISSGAGFLDSFGAYEQGSGLVNVFQSLPLLLSGPRPDAVTTAVPVHTVLSDQLAKPGIGVGIHDREGVAVGAEYTRTYTVTRTSGAPGSAVFTARWVGNDGTFSSPAAVWLPLNKPVSFPVKVSARTAGVHSALLRLDNPFTEGVDVQTLNTVFAAQEFSKDNGFAITATGTIGRSQAASVFVRVPANASELRVDLDAGGPAGAGQVRFLRYDPTGVPIESVWSGHCYHPATASGCPAGSPLSRTAAKPRPGVWEIVIEARRTSDVLEAPYSVRLSVTGV